MTARKKMEEKKTIPVKVYDGTNLLLGRLASLVAKDALMGLEVRVVNCEKVVISGKRQNVLAHEYQRFQRGGYPLKGPRVSRLPDRFFRRTVRGMLPHKQARGREAWKRVMCYVGLPPEFQNQPLLSPSPSSVKKLPHLHYATLLDVCQQMGLGGHTHT